MEYLKAFRTLECTYEKAPEIFCAKYDQLRSEEMKEVYSQIYKPSDDTYLLIDAIYADLDNLVKSSPSRCLEIGPGSGLVTTTVALLLQKNYEEVYKNMKFYTLDVNEKASEATLFTFAQCNDLPESKIETITGSFNDYNNKEDEKSPDLQTDILIFNPPYVPCTDEEMEEALEKKDVSAAWAGGYGGREVIDKLIPKVRDFLSPTGIFYFLLIEDNDIYDITKSIIEAANEGLLEDQPKLTFEPIMKRECLGERQVIIKFYFE
ncbi:unnamed protein product [Moneuplotes crassus]|uniref:Uncharacterized protein n=1 Tax=Euplotes crassus TaxID=5936 RepID=A0AAD2D2X6_EUPCR|nr:unnamed protein product [Moneuplotes crassus]